MPASLFPLFALILAATQPSPRTPADPELGLVRWGRDLDVALATSRASGKPVLVLFDEVPGCATCVGFGQEVLSHPLLVEAIEHEFVPVFVANNRAGRDAELLARFDEPAWNNPVVRLLDANGRDLLPRRDGLYSAHEIATRLLETLHAAQRPVPGYLAIAEAETRRAHRREATFAMGCFWEGEARLGSLPGVLDVRAVHTDRGEGVRVTYDASRIAPEALAKAAAAKSCALLPEGVTASHDAGGPDHLHALAASPLRKLALTPIQAMRVNAALASGSDGLEWLTPTQREQANAGRGGHAKELGRAVGLGPHLFCTRPGPPVPPSSRSSPTRPRAALPTCRPPTFRVASPSDRRTRRRRAPTGAPAGRPGGNPRVHSFVLRRDSLPP